MDWISPRRLKNLGMLNMNRRNVDYIARYNDRTSYPLVDNKLKTKLAVSEYGVKTPPKLLQVVRQQHEISHFAKWQRIWPVSPSNQQKALAARALP